VIGAESGCAPVVVKRGHGLSEYLMRLFAIRLEGENEPRSFCFPMENTDGYGLRELSRVMLRFAGRRPREEPLGLYVRPLCTRWPLTLVKLSREEGLGITGPCEVEGGGAGRGTSKNRGSKIHNQFQAV
jgi:hypothetical protein